MVRSKELVMAPKVGFPGGGRWYAEQSEADAHGGVYCDARNTNCYKWLNRLNKT